jgi:23S rRNA pseudouridine1911/1915/1917 synthase
MQSWKVTDESAGKRLDVFIAKQVPQLSRSSIQKLADQNKLLVEKQPEKAGYKLKNGQKVSLNYNLQLLDQIPDIELPILYEDEDCLVIDKPVGVLTHSKGVFNPEPTVATFIAPKLKSLEGERAGIVHRLDRATSGVIICAKHEAALKWLQKQFAQRRTKKHYIAVVEGHLDPSEAMIDIPIERNPIKPKAFRAGAAGKPAITEYKVVSTNRHYSLIDLFPKTGRTHQLRVHLQHLGYPIVGDTLYGGKDADRLYLHAKSLEITLPNKERKIFEASVPAAFTAIMK